jgi:hypothetical protein
LCRGRDGPRQGCSPLQAHRAREHLDRHTPSPGWAYAIGRHAPPTGRRNGRPMTGSGGASSTPRPIVSIIGVSGILDHPPARVMTTEYDFTIPRRDTPEVLLKRRPSKEGAGNAGCALHPRSRVQNCAKNRTRAYRFSGNTPAFPAQWLYGLCRDLLGDEFVLSPSLPA